MARIWSNGRTLSGLISSTFMTCQPFTLFHGPPTLPGLVANTESASAGSRPITANCPSRETCPRLPPLVLVSESVEYCLASFAKSAPLARASGSTFCAVALVFT